MIAKGSRKKSQVCRLIPSINRDPYGAYLTETYRVGVAQGCLAPSERRSHRMRFRSTLLWGDRKEHLCEAILL
jgi:hypothetical protein